MFRPVGPRVAFAGSAGTGHPYIQQQANSKLSILGVFHRQRLRTPRSPRCAHLEGETFSRAMEKFQSVFNSSPVHVFEPLF